mmetsp:Transcript_38087/g.123496  ORF Transcript_38087/g.123496 Transcript_38087/m.123496 type:complete len:204 (+) Transcript_38087:56-667(+)
MPPVSRPVRRLRTIEIDELPAGTSSSLSPAARSAAVVGGSTDLIGHTLRGSSRVRGAIAIICVLSILLVGPSLPLALLHALWSGRLHLAAALAAVILASALLPVRESALAARLYLQAAGFLRHGVSFWVERRVMDVMQADDGSMWCYEPRAGRRPLSLCAEAITPPPSAGACTPMARPSASASRSTAPSDSRPSGRTCTCRPR